MQVVPGIGAHTVEIDGEFGALSLIEAKTVK